MSPRHGNTYIDQDPKTGLRQISDLIPRLFAEASDHRVLSWHFPTLAAAATIDISNNQLKPSRDWAFIRLAVSGNALGAGSNITVYLFAGAARVAPAVPPATSQIYTVNLVPGGIGWTSGISSTSINLERENINVNTGWGVAGINTAGGAWADLTIEVVYEDFVPEFSHGL